MKITAFAIAATLNMANAHAGCPELNAFVQRYGISFGGFAEPIPAVNGPALSGKGQVLRLPIHYLVPVSDGFRHTVLFDAGTRKAWIERTGGFIGVHEWYGPVDAGDAKLENCRPEPKQAEPVLIVQGNLKR